MLAPRKKLWSTPDTVIAKAIAWVPLQPGDLVGDVGCGDGRVLLQWATAFSQTNGSQLSSWVSSRPNESIVSFIGIDVDYERVECANAALRVAREQGHIHPAVQVSFHCTNALDATDLYANVTVFFLYLIPRGLRILQPHLPRTARCILTYMSPLPDRTLIQRELVPVPHQPGAAWPLHLYSNRIDNVARAI